MPAIKTINLTGTKTQVNFDRPFAYVECNNLGESDVLFSTKPNIERGADDVIIVKAGSTATIGDLGVPKIKTVYLNGSGEVQLVAKAYPESSFKQKAKGGDENNLLPHSNGLVAYFDYSKNTTDTSWTDIVGEMTVETDFILSDDFISPVSSNAIMPIILNNPYTLYVIVKQNITNSAWSGILTNQTNNFGIFANQNKIAVHDPSTREGYTTDVSALNYHICAITFYNGLGSLYVDGVLKFTRTNINLANFPYYITYIGDYKMIGLCNNVAHGSKYILENTNYLAEKYGIEI